MSDLPKGLYDQLVTAGLKARLLAFDRNRTLIQQKAVDTAEAHSILARHVGEAVARALRELSAEDRLQKQVQLTNDLVRMLGGIEDSVEVPPEVLQSIQGVTGR